jgi:hypothetical protein
MASRCDWRAFEPFTGNDEVLSSIGVNRISGCCVSVCDELLSASGLARWRTRSWVRWDWR